MKHVLIIEDDPLLVRIYSVRFHEEGYETEVVTDGAQALASIRKRVPDVILLDLVMPGMDGYAFLAAYRKEGFPDVPVLVLSNLDQASDIRKAKEMKVRDFIVKGASDLDQIVAKLKEYCPDVPVSAGTASQPPVSIVPPTAA